MGAFLGASSCHGCSAKGSACKVIFMRRAPNPRGEGAKLRAETLRAARALVEEAGLPRESVLRRPYPRPLPSGRKQKSKRHPSRRAEWTILDSTERGAEHACFVGDRAKQ
jgi:hypothetical protein